MDVALELLSKVWKDLNSDMGNLVAILNDFLELDDWTVFQADFL